MGEYEEYEEYESGTPIGQSVIKFILSPEFPRHHKELFEMFRPFVDKTAALGNYDRIEMEILRLDLELARLYIKIGCLDLAREKMLHFVNTVQLSRGKEGFWTRMQSTQIQKIEEKVLAQETEQRRRRLLGALFGRKRKEVEE